MKSLLLCRFFNWRTLKSVGQKITVCVYQTGRTGQDGDQGKEHQYKGLLLLVRLQWGLEVPKFKDRSGGVVLGFYLLGYSPESYYPLFSHTPSHCVAAQDHCLALNVQVLTQEKREDAFRFMFLYRKSFLKARFHTDVLLFFNAN